IPSAPSGVFAAARTTGKRAASFAVRKRARHARIAVFNATNEGLSGFRGTVYATGSIGITGLLVVLPAPAVGAGEGMPGTGDEGAGEAVVCGCSLVSPASFACAKA